MLRSVLIVLALVLSGSAAVAPEFMPWDAASPDSVMRRLVLHLFCALASVPLILSIHAGYSRKISPSIGIEVLVSWGAAILQLALITSTLMYFQTWRANLSALETFGDADVFEIDGLIFLEGVIGLRAAEAVRSELKMTPAKALVVDSPGGVIAVSVEIAQIVKQRALPVHVSGSCASACVVIASASPNLSAENNAVFGFHRGSAIVEATDSWTRFQSESATDELIAILRNQGIPEDILVIAKETAPDDMYWISARDLHERGVVIDITD
jgi:ATP-dependent protease ClpP protease subunit